MRFAGTVLAGLGAAAMTFAGLMKVFNIDFRADMADNYEIFGAELPAWFFVIVGLAELAIAALIINRRTRIIGAMALTMFMGGALILNLGFAKDVLAECVRDHPRTATYGPVGNLRPVQAPTTGPPTCERLVT